MRRLGLTMGDPAGIGPEIVLKAIHQRPPPAGWQFVLIGSAREFSRALKQTGLACSWTPSSPETDAPVVLFDLQAEIGDDDLFPGSAAGGRAALASLETACRLALDGFLAGLVTAPLNKAGVARAGRKFIGQTEWLAERTGQPGAAMMLLGRDSRDRWLRVSLATTHAPLREVPGLLSTAAISSVIGLTAEACRLLGMTEPRIGVCGLNPHAGEEGVLGREEDLVIRPAIARARAQAGAACSIAGPLPADTLFHQAYEGGYDAVVAMYHDQGLTPLKMVAFDRGVNWTLGLPFIRTSPDHGTAYDIAGKNLASPSSMEAAMNLAVQLAQCADPWPWPTQDSGK